MNETRLADPSEYEAIDRLIDDAYAHDYGPSDHRDEMRFARVRAEAFDVWVARDETGELLGSVLPYMTLIKPLNKRARELGNERAAATMEYALTTLLLTFTEANGANGYGVYERMKALAPNQFFSLNQVGIERSISVDSPYTDIWTMGFDPIDGTIKDCRDMAYRDKEEDVRNVLLAVKNALQVIWNIAASL